VTDGLAQAMTILAVAIGLGALLGSLRRPQPPRSTFTFMDKFGVPHELPAWLWDPKRGSQLPPLALLVGGILMLPLLWRLLGRGRPVDPMLQGLRPEVRERVERVRKRARSGRKA